MEQTLDEPVKDKFPDLSGFVVILKNDGSYLLGAGVLSDGLIVPLFPDLDSAHEVIQDLSDDPRDMQLRAENLGEPFKAMRKAAGEGAAGFQFSAGMFNDRQRQAVFSITQGRIIFPFMARYSEAGSQWPTVLGSALRCDEGSYLDYAPVSVQIVKALEYEMRELASYLVSGYSGTQSIDASREEETLFFVRENQRDKVSLGSLTYAIKALKSPKAPILEYLAKRLFNSGLGMMTERSTWRLILEDVLKKYRNGGAHEHAISYATCEDCIKDLIGSTDQPGLVPRLAGWRGQSG